MISVSLACSPIGNRDWKSCFRDTRWKPRTQSSSGCAPSLRSSAAIKDCPEPKAVPGYRELYFNELVLSPGWRIDGSSGL